KLPKVPEACPNGLAPTTSTTMMIALGDALAVSLLHRMGLTPEQYKIFHPGGKLGQKLMTVTELMIPYDSLPLVDKTAQMDKAILMLSEKNLGSVIIINEDGAVQGIITDGDLKRHMDANLLQKPVTAIMSTSPKTIEKSLLAVEAVNIMTENPGHYISSLLVMDNGKLAGMIRLQDCIQAGLL
ncbi:MAG: CBS domain-containing protein, partial [Alphaproteobacteria bacterium]|nr:CBS domain-containing protein [Alphaproteobacteria bacterium]